MLYTFVASVLWVAVAVNVPAFGSAHDVDAVPMISNLY
jgi:hypothetical protein